VTHSAKTHRPLPAEGAAAPPRINGELVFDAPWQSRAFGVAAALAESGLISWADFQAALISQVGEADTSSADTGSPDGYWTCWLEALGSVTASAGVVADQDWAERSAVFANRPAGHDHSH